MSAQRRSAGSARGSFLRRQCKAGLVSQNARREIFACRRACDDQHTCLRQSWCHVHFTPNATLCRPAGPRSCCAGTNNWEIVPNVTRMHRHVRFGSEADICAATSHVRFTPNSDHERRHAAQVMSALGHKRILALARLGHFAAKPSDPNAD